MTSIKSTNYAMSIYEVHIDSLSYDDTIKLTLNELAMKESSIDLNCYKPIRIDSNGKILEGIDRFLILLKAGKESVSVIKEGKRSKINLSVAANSEEIFMLAA